MSSGSSDVGAQSPLPSEVSVGGHPVAKASWGPLAAILYGFFGTAFGVQIVSSVLLVLFLAAIGMQQTDIESWSTTITGQFVFVLAAELFMILAVVLYLRLKKSSLRVLGVNKPRLSYIGIILLGTLAYFGLYILTVITVSLFAPSIDMEQRQQLGFDSPVGLAQYIMIFTSLVLLPPLAEETVFRGFIFGGLRSKLHFLPTALITSVLFAVGHLQFGSGAPLLWIAAIDTFVLSLVLCYVRERTGSIWPSVGIHAVKNLIAFTLLYVFS